MSNSNIVKKGYRFKSLKPLSLRPLIVLTHLCFSSLPVYSIIKQEKFGTILFPGKLTFSLVSSLI